MHMHLISIALLAVAANVDNLAVAIAYGIKHIKIGLRANLFIALVSALGTFLSISVGEEISGYLSIPVANALGSLILIAAGAWGIWETLKRERKKARSKARVRQKVLYMAAIGGHSIDSDRDNDAQEFLQEFSYENFLEHPERADSDRSGYIDPRESIALAFGLTLNNLSSGIGGGISGLNVSLTTLLVFGLSVAAISGGYALGGRFSVRMTGLWAALLSGGLVIATGLYEFFV